MKKGKSLFSYFCSLAFVFFQDRIPVCLLSSFSLCGFFSEGLEVGMDLHNAQDCLVGAGLWGSLLSSCLLSSACAVFSRSDMSNSL